MRGLRLISKKETLSEVTIEKQNLQKKVDERVQANKNASILF